MISFYPADGLARDKNHIQFSIHSQNHRMNSMQAFVMHVSQIKWPTAVLSFILTLLACLSVWLHWVAFSVCLAPSVLLNSLTASLSDNLKMPWDMPTDSQCCGASPFINVYGVLWCWTSRLEPVKASFKTWQWSTAREREEAADAVLTDWMSSFQAACSRERPLSKRTPLPSPSIKHYGLPRL